MAQKNETQKDFWSTTISFPRDQIPKSVRVLNPIIFSDAPDAYCCYFGADFMVGVAGCGTTVLAAMEAFDKAFQQKLKGGEVPDWIFHKNTGPIQEHHEQEKG